MSRTRIVILQVKELIYTAIFVALGILLLILLFFMFWPDKEKEAGSTASNAVSSTTAEETADAGLYRSGVYTSELSLGNSTINLQVTLDTDRVKSVELVNLDDSVSTMYPLLQPAVEDISNQLAQNVSPEEVVLSDDSQYTQQMILDTISGILDEASQTTTSD